jgi:hypothetical protein
MSIFITNTLDSLRTWLVVSGMNNLTRGEIAVIKQHTHRVKTVKGQNGPTKFVVYSTLKLHFANKTGYVL